MPAARRPARGFRQGNLAVHGQHLPRRPERAARCVDSTDTRSSTSASRCTTASPACAATSSARSKLTDSTRYGLLGKGGVLMASAYPNRTSPVLRGAFVLERIIGRAAAAAAAGCRGAARNQCATRSRPPCASCSRCTARSRSASSCHASIDPIGFVLEGFDATGKARTIDRFARTDIDTMGKLPDGTIVRNPDELRSGADGGSGAPSCRTSPSDC